MKNKTQNIFILIYYAILLLIMMSRKEAVSEPGLFSRIAFLSMTLFPCILSKSIIYPAIITLFYSLTIFGFSYSYYPYTQTLYVVLTFVFILFFYGKQLKRKVIPLFLLFFTIYILFVDLLSSVFYNEANLFENVFCSFLLLCFFIILTSGNLQKSISQLSEIFIVITIVLSFLFLENRELFAVDYGEGLERSSWTDPNYFGTLLGMGTVIAFFNIFDKEWKNKSKIKKVTSLLVIFLSLPVLLLNASRGALLSVILVFMFLVIFSKLKILNKAIIILLSIIGVVYLYSNEYFALLELRIASDDGTGSGRTEIWSSKLDAFSNGNILQMIFGHGFYGGGKITGRTIGFHNDFIGFLVDYGLIGIGMLLYMLYYPIKIVPKKSKNKIVVISSVFYLSFCFLTLEPFLTGILPFFVFYLYAFLLAKKEQNDLKCYEFNK